MTTHHGSYRRQLKRMGNSQTVDDEFLVFGYSATLHDPIDIHQSNKQTFDENKHLISWNGDDNLKIDRYDCRLYLASLDDFNELYLEKQRKKAEQQSINVDTDNEEDSAEKLEEELCEEERYFDLYIDIQKKELEESGFKTTKKAEISFNYDDNIETDKELTRAERDLEIEQDEPYIKPNLLKLPVGIVTPDTMRQSSLIERTAQFVVDQGPQMEVVIKAKQRHNMEQFGFLDFDHRLHSYYKYLCKLIRQKKYTPETMQTKRKLAKTPTPPSSEESDSDDEGNYLHPLLSGKSKKELTSIEPGFIGPTQKPLTQKPNVVKPESPGPDLNALLQQFHNSANQQNTLYSSLMKGLNSVLPGNKLEEASKGAMEMLASDTNILACKVKTLYETDEHRINDYNKWHLDFYGLPSPYLPGPPPIPMPPEPESAVESSITVAGKYVAFHGAAAEQRLIDHNGDKVHFIFPRSPYYTYYQSRVRQLQWQLYQQRHQEMQARNLPISPGVPTPSTSSTLPSLLTLIPNPPQRPVSLIKQIQQQMNDSSTLIPTELPIKQQEFSMNVVETGEIENIDKKQYERREKARLFMERILNERKAEKQRKIKGFEDNEQLVQIEQQRQIALDKNESSNNINFDQHQSTLTTTTTNSIVASNSTISPLQLSKAISTLIDEQIKRSLADSTETNSIKDEEKIEKRKYSFDVDNSNSDDERNRKQRRKLEKSWEMESSDEDRISTQETHKRQKRRRKDDRSSERHRQRRSSRCRSRSTSRSRSRSARRSRRRV